MIISIWNINTLLPAWNRAQYCLLFKTRQTSQAKIRQTLQTRWQQLWTRVNVSLFKLLASLRHIKLRLRYMDKEHLKGAENQGVIWACLITRKGTRQVMGTGMGPETNEHTWRLPRDRWPRSRGRHCAFRLLWPDHREALLDFISSNLPFHLVRQTLKTKISQ